MPVYVAGALVLDSEALLLLPVLVEAVGRGIVLVPFSTIAGGLPPPPGDPVGLAAYESVFPFAVMTPPGVSV